MSLVPNDPDVPTTKDIVRNTRPDDRLRAKNSARHQTIVTAFDQNLQLLSKE
jgi:hypothetical protein